LLGVTCINQTVCLTTGVYPNPTGPYVGVVLRSTDDGNTWTPVVMPENTLGLGAVTCPTASLCIAVGAEIMTSQDQGATWQERTVDGGTQGLTSITCTSMVHCVAIGPNVAAEFNSSLPAIGVVTNDGGNSWQQQPMPVGTATLDKLTCATALQCFAAGPQVQSSQPAPLFTTNDGGNTWNATPAPSGFSAITDLSCPAPNNCVVVGRSGNQSTTAVTSDGSTWATTAVPAS
jgi:photosystem II stability/assembly factor-like uncharacterized protein